MNRAEFWEAFARTHWEREPLQQAPGGDLLPVDEAAVFDILLACLTPGVQSGVNLTLHTLSEGDVSARATKEVPAPWLPLRTDGSLAGYRDRLVDVAAGRRYCLVVGQVIKNVEHWFAARDFWSGLCNEVGLPWGRIVHTLFLGNYSTTPFGAHDHPAGVFVFPISGRKRMRIWRGAYVRQCADFDPFDYAEHRESSTLLEAGPGGLIYWPSDVWHVAESEEDWTVSLSAGFWDGSARDLALRALGAEQRRPQGSAVRTVDPPRPSGGGEAEVPGVLADVLEALAKECGSSQAEGRLTRLWLRRVTSVGIPNPVPMRANAIPLEEMAAVWNASGYPVRWTVAPEGRTLVAANGWVQGLRVTDVSALTSLLADVNSGRRLEVAALRARVDERLATGELESLLNFLYKSRAIDIERV
ncbi:MAG: cupin domain-containing protein [Acidimicrobiia bacterium]|nr:cupin domain-containing protein [Acidimicrobiia bacterium]